MVVLRRASRSSNSVAPKSANKVPAEQTAWRPSRFNFFIRENAGPEPTVALFNSATGALTKVDGPDATSLATLLNNPGADIDEVAFGTGLLDTLVAGGFLVPAGRDEVSQIRNRYWAARDGTPAVLTITTTMDCNLGCYYCYEERSQSALEANSIDPILNLIDETVIGAGRKSLHVDWYGGEPLLNVDFLSSASQAIQAHCASKGISYAASIISNGTLWPDDPAAFVKCHAIRQVQISFDGMRRNHDRRRRTRRGYRHVGNRLLLSSFDEAVSLVDALVNVVRVDVRFNIDRGNLVDLMPFLDMAEERGWFQAAFPAVFQPARLAAYSSKSSFMRAAELTLAEFDKARAAVRDRLEGTATVEESDAPDGYPHPKSSVCAALSRASTVVGAEGALYRCGLQVGEPGRAVGYLAASQDSPDVPPDAEWWSGFDPTRLPTCQHCSFLPVCWGGCPKKHLEGDIHAIREQGRYWRTNLPRMIARAAGIEGSYSPTSFTEEQQFRADESRPKAEVA